MRWRRPSVIQGAIHEHQRLVGVAAQGATSISSTFFLISLLLSCSLSNIKLLARMLSFLLCHIAFIILILVTSFSGICHETREGIQHLLPLRPAPNPQEDQTPSEVPEHSSTPYYEPSPEDVLRDSTPIKKKCPANKPMTCSHADRLRSPAYKCTSFATRILNTTVTTLLWCQCCPDK